MNVIYLRFWHINHHALYGKYKNLVVCDCTEYKTRTQIPFHLSKDKKNYAPKNLKLKRNIQIWFCIDSNLISVFFVLRWFNYLIFLSNLLNLYQGLLEFRFGKLSFLFYFYFLRFWIHEMDQNLINLSWYICIIHRKTKVCFKF